jgi:ABC-type sugar transport system substrate-binding protein
MITGNGGLNQVGVRIDAFKQELAKTPGLKVVAVEDGNWDLATSQKIAQQLFAKYRGQGGIQAAYGMADNQAIGIVAAAKQAGMKIGGPDGLIVTGSNCYQAGLQAIKAGQMFGTATQSPGEEAKFTSDLVIKYLNGEQIPPRSYAPESRITRANVNKMIGAKACP